MKQLFSLGRDGGADIFIPSIEKAEKMTLNGHQMEENRGEWFPDRPSRRGEDDERARL